MAWRSVVISSPARLSYHSRALIVEQESRFSVPLEDIAAIVLDCPQITLTAPLLSACAAQQVAVICVDETHTPNGLLLPFTPHSRARKVMQSQLDMTLPHKKRLWQTIVQQKLRNQAWVVHQVCGEHAAQPLTAMAAQVRSGDPDNFEAQAAQQYFPLLFGRGFTRDQSGVVNAALNYGYSIMRSALARSLVAYGFLPAFGVHHRSQLNAFNLADDLIEPYRPLVDRQVYRWVSAHAQQLNRQIKADLVSLLHQDAPRIQDECLLGSSSLLALADATVISLSQAIQDKSASLVLPGVPS